MPEWFNALNKLIKTSVCSQNQIIKVHYLNKIWEARLISQEVKQ